MLAVIAEKQNDEELPSSPEVHKLASQVNHLKQLLADAESQLKEAVAKCQAKCQHEWQKVFKRDSKYHRWVYGDWETRTLDVYLGRKCKKCFVFEPRAEGSKFEICHKCGSHMKYDGSTHIADMRVQTYKCAECGFEEAHT